MAEAKATVKKPRASGAHLTNLMIVESPTKATKISGFLGKDWTVLASIGHIRDLTNGGTMGLGLKVEDHFAPLYDVDKGSTQTVKKLQTALKKAKAIYLASDPDREGEAIAWHLQEVLKPDAGEKPFYRIRFHEITKDAITRAIDHADHPETVAADETNKPGIDEDLVEAQKARRSVDRVLGFRLTNWVQKVRGCQSAGRVQSVALKFVVERDLAISNFVAQKYWLPEGTFAVPQGVIPARLAKIDGFNITKPSDANDAKSPTDTAATKTDTPATKGDAPTGKSMVIDSEAQAAEYIAELEKAAFEVGEIKTQAKSYRPQPPLITSAFLQAAGNMGFSVAAAMQGLKALYETGFITYPRTDLAAVSIDAQRAAKAYIIQKFGEDYVPERPNVYVSAAKMAEAHTQGAHEALRPTDVTLTGSQLPDEVSPRDRKLYDLVRRRFLASQMSAARKETLTVEIKNATTPACKHTYQFTAAKTRVLFKGYLAALPEHDETEDLPEVKSGDKATLKSFDANAKETQPPGHLSEAGLVKRMEDEGIGRPSTYASTVQTLQKRAYVVNTSNRLTATPSGIRVVEALNELAPEFMDVRYTATMETELDQIAAGAKPYESVVRDCWDTVGQWLRADPAEVRPVLALFDTVTKWEGKVKAGETETADQIFVQNVKDALTSPEGVSRGQLARLKKIAGTYADQIPNADHVFEPLGITKPACSMDECARRFEVLKKLELDEAPKKIANSMQSRFKRGSSLSLKQLALLDTFIAENLSQLPDDEQIAIKEEFDLQRIQPRETDTKDRADPEASRRVVEILGKVTTWREPAAPATEEPAKKTRGRKKATRTGDKEFYESVAGSFKRRGSLTERQLKALAKMGKRYADQFASDEVDYLASFAGKPKEK